MNPPSTKGDFARTHADSIAAAASLGYITTRTDLASFSRRWHLTPAGLCHLWVIKGFDE